MKSQLKTLFIASLLWISSTSVSAQAQSKIGYVNWQAIAAQMPEMQRISQKLNKLVKSKQEQGQKLMKAFLAKQQKYSQEAPKQTPAINKKRSEELHALEQEIQRKEQEATQEVNQKKEKLMQPLLEKVQNAIDVVAKKGKYDAIFRSEALLYFKSQSDNIAPKVLKQLGIKPPTRPLVRPQTEGMGRPRGGSPLTQHPVN